MPKKRGAIRPAEPPGDGFDFNQQTIPAPRHRLANGRDPREPLPLGNTDADEQQASAQTQEVLPPEIGHVKKTAENLATQYAKALIAFEGDVVAALATVFDVDKETARKNMVELHERARGASRINTSVSDMIERHDLTTEVRLARLREMFFDDRPAVALKAIDMINEMDATSKSKRIGTSWETFVSRVRAGLGPKARAQQEAHANKT